MQWLSVQGRAQPGGCSTGMLLNLLVALWRDVAAAVCMQTWPSLQWLSQEWLSQEWPPPAASLHHYHGFRYLRASGC